MEDEKPDRPIRLEIQCENAKEAKLYLSASDYSLLLWDFDQYLRQIVKYQTFKNRETTEAEQEVAEEIRKQLWNLLNEYNIQLD